MGYCTECGASLADDKNFCPQCGKRVGVSDPAPGKNTVSETPLDQQQQNSGQAHFHRISGSTQYLIKGTRSLQGKRFETLEEIRHFYDHHDEVLAETTESIARQQDAIILGLTNDEMRLDMELQEAIARTTVEVDAAILDLDRQSKEDPGILIRIGYRAWYWIAVALRNHRIHSPNSGLARDLGNVRNRKRQQMITKDSLIQQESYNITRSYEFLKEKESFLIGADGEEHVIGVLSQLPAGYHVINDVNLHFSKAIHWREYNEYIKNCQIDHVVVGPTGIFLLETKNWKASDIKEKSGDLRRQVRRSNTALWYYLRDYYWMSKQPKIRSVVVSMKGSAGGHKPDKYIDVVPPRNLCRYITARDIVLADDAIDKLVGLLAR
jgi:uncharacterized Zn finger protein (UPF0148 family)